MTSARRAPARYDSGVYGSYQMEHTDELKLVAVAGRLCTLNV